jgi:formylglycine-generating enzyme required for sulfatase activity
VDALPDVFLDAPLDASPDSSPDSSPDAPPDASGDAEAGADSSVHGPHCLGLPATCGSTGDRDCCASAVVPGGTFHRDNADAATATVSDFRLDIYEVTAGRFHSFVEAYPGSMPAAGSGKNPNNPTDPGWYATWNGSGYLPQDQATLASLVQCTGYEDYTRNPNLPMNCITWYEAFAFCIWDGGRLPTEAEWNYAAAGGTDQRPFPWSKSPSDLTINSNFANYAPSPDYTLVGSKSSAGDGKWGHADMAGNVWEWTADWYGTYPATCTNCANLDYTIIRPYPYRIFRGGSVGDPAIPFEETSYRNYNVPSFRSDDVIGVRCARNP